MRSLTPEQTIFLTERHLATLTTLRADGTPHVVPVAFTWDADAQLIRITTERTSVKARNIALGDGAGGTARVAVCQVDGGRWLTAEGTATVSDDPGEVAEAVRRYAVRYRQLEHNPERVVLLVRPHRVLGSGYMTR